MAARKRRLLLLGWVMWLVGLTGCPLSPKQQRLSPTPPSSLKTQPSSLHKEASSAKGRCIEGQLKIYKEPTTTQYGILQLRSLRHSMRFQLANPSRRGAFSFCSLVEVIDADTNATRRYPLQSGRYRLTHVRDGFRASVDLRLDWHPQRGERWFVARVGENQMAAFARFRRPRLKLSRRGWPAPLSDPCRLATSHYAKGMAQLLHPQQMHLSLAWLHRLGSNQRDPSYKRWPFHKRRLRVRWLHYEPWALTAHILNPHARALRLSTKGLYLLPQGKPAHAPQRIAAIGPHCVLTTNGWQPTKQSLVPAGQGRLIRVPIYSLDPHRTPPAPQQLFSQMARLPAAWLHTLTHYRKRCAQTRAKHKRRWPLRPIQEQAILWFTRRHHWITLKGEGHQEQAQLKRLLQATPIPTPQQIGCQLGP